MKNVLYFLVILLVLDSCKQQVDNVPVPQTPTTLTIPADSVMLNPYGYTPLAALVRFSSTAVGRAFVRVRGKHGGLTTIEHTLNDRGTVHTIPVVGLYPDFANTVDVGVLGDGGDTLATQTLTIQTGDLPPNMPLNITAAPFDEKKVAPGLVLVSNFSTLNTGSPSTPYFMDAYGDIRWVLDYRNHPQLKTLSYDDGIDRLRNGNLFFGDINSAAIYEVDLLGQVVHSWPLPGYLFHHNVVEEPNGNFLLTASKSGSTHPDGTPTIEDYVIELDRTSGRLLTEWDLKQSLDEHRTALSASSIYSSTDWFHGNAVMYDSTDNTIIVSGRHQGVAKLDYNNQVKWILGPHAGWGTNRRGQDLNPFLLQPLDANDQRITSADVINGNEITTDFEWNWYQHDPILLPNGALMIFDNGDIREFDTESPKYSRAVSYRIDPRAMTVQQDWTYGKERGLDTYSEVVSSVQFLTGATSHVLFSPGYQVQNTAGRGGKVLEIDALTKEVVSEISMTAANGWGFHRAKKMSIYP